MISFIVIGRNEGWKLNKCLESIFEVITKNHLKKYEVLYIDSKSTDKSVSFAENYNEVKVIKLTSDFNAAIARNVGFKESNGNVLYFIDGDMEIKADFLAKVYSPDEGLRYNFVTGNYINKYYDHQGNLLHSSPYHNLQEPKKDIATGGLFLIERKLWKLVNGMRNDFKRSQDIDFTLRLAKKHIFVTRLPDFAAIHHTISYKDRKRKWHMLFNKSELYGRIYLYRRNFLNFYAIKLMIKNDYTLLSLIFVFILSIVSGTMYFMLLYILPIFYKLFGRIKKESNGFLEDLFYLIARDIFQIMGIFFFWPGKNFKIQYDSV
jgi:glycosyltransferase involved in cell wall biosynthesis